MAHNNSDNVVNRETEILSRASSIDRVSVKVPAFMPTDPGLWFLLLEGSFDAAGITQDSTKFGHVLTALDQRYALEVRDILSLPRGERSYELLKTELIKRLGTTREQNTRRLLENEPLGDRKPSQFLRHLRGLAGPGFPEDVLQTLWLGRLPRNVQALLAAHRDLSLDKRADIADTVAEAYGMPGSISETTVATASSSMQEQIETLIRAMSTTLQRLAAIESNTQRVDYLSSGMSRSHPRSRSRSRSRPRSLSRQPGTANGLCWYHGRFGEQARKCEKPCNFNAGPSGNDQGSR